MKTFKRLPSVLLASCLLLAACSDSNRAQSTPTPSQTTHHTSTPSASVTPPLPSNEAATRITFDSETIEGQPGIAVEGADYYLIAWCSDHGGFSAEVWDDQGFIMSQVLPCLPQQTTMATALTGQGQEIWIELKGVSDNYPSQGFVEIAPMPAPTPAGQ